MEFLLKSLNFHCVFLIFPLNQECLGDSDTLAEMKTFMNEHFIAKHSEYTEIMTFRSAFGL